MQVLGCYLVLVPLSRKTTLIRQWICPLQQGITQGCSQVGLCLASKDEQSFLCCFPTQFSHAKLLAQVSWRFQPQSFSCCNNLNISRTTEVRQALTACTVPQEALMEGFLIASQAFPTGGLTSSFPGMPSFQT